MGFVQIVELDSPHFDELNRLEDEWLVRTEGRRTVRRGLICRDRDHENRYVMVVEFDSYDSAMLNSGLPETTEIAEQIEKVAAAPPVFRNLDVIRTL